ncbi:hypothetical protein TrRE_jg6112, partial [Triparma retinervis]
METAPAAKQTAAHTPQTVHDLLHSSGPTTLPGIEKHLTQHLGKKDNVDRRSLLAVVSAAGRGTAGLSKGVASRGYLVDPRTIKVCLRVLLIHGIVKAGHGGIARGTNNKAKGRGVYYEVDESRAARMGRYQRYLEHLGDTMGGGGPSDEGVTARIAKTVMVEGMAEAEEIVRIVEKGFREEEEDSDSDSDDERVRDVNEDRIGRIAAGLAQMISDRVITAARRVVTDEVSEEEKVGWKGSGPAAETKVIERKVEEALKGALPGGAGALRGEVWTLNCWILDRRLRGCQISRFVEERCRGTAAKEDPGTGGRTAGAVWRAASFLAAEKAEGKVYDFTFAAEDILSVLQSNPGLAKGGAFEEDKPIDGQVKEALKELAGLKNPSALLERGGEEWEICYDECEEVVKERRVGHYVSERWGEDCARIFSGVAMLPEKVTREMLHTLYTSGLAEFHNFPTTKQHAYTQTIYLWGAETRKVMDAVDKALRTALVNIRDRRRVYINSDK